MCLLKMGSFSKLAHLPHLQNHIRVWHDYLQFFRCSVRQVNRGHARSRTVKEWPRILAFHKWLEGTCCGFHIYIVWRCAPSYRPGALLLLVAGTALRNLPPNEEKALRSKRENCISREKRWKEELERLTKNHKCIPPYQSYRNLCRIESQLMQWLWLIWFWVAEVLSWLSPVKVSRTRSEV